MSLDKRLDEIERAICRPPPTTVQRRELCYATLTSDLEDLVVSAFPAPPSEMSRAELLGHAAAALREWQPTPRPEDVDELADSLACIGRERWRAARTQYRGGKV